MTRTPRLALEPLNDRLTPDAVGTNLTVQSAGYLGGAGNDSSSAVDIGANNTIVVGGTITTDVGAASTPLLAGGNGAVYRFDATGTQVLSITRLGPTVTDLQVDPASGRIAVAGAFGVTVLSPDGADTVWDAFPGSVARVSIGTDGTVAAVVNKTVFVYDAAGSLRGQFEVSGTKVNDVAVDGANGAVIVAGYTQSLPDLQVPFLRAYSADGTVRWRAYDFNGTDVAGATLTADSRGTRVTIGRDGKLYFAGRTDGGNNVFARNPADLATAAARNVETDNYTKTFGINSGSFAYFARFNPATGEHEVGQFFITRQGNQADGTGTGNSFTITAITADEAGQVYIGGESAFQLPDRPRLTVNGRPTGEYKLGEGAVVSVSPDFRTRRMVTVWSGPGTTTASGVTGVAAANGLRAVSSTAGANMLTTRPVQATIGGGTDAFYSVWGAPTVPPAVPPVVPPVVPPAVPPIVPPVVPPVVPPTVPFVPPPPPMVPVVPPAVPPAVPPVVSPPPRTSPQDPADRTLLVGTDRVVVGTGPSGDRVSVFDENTRRQSTFTPFAGFTGGIRTASADFNADGVPDVVVATGPGRATEVQVRDGADTSRTLFSLQPFEAAFRGGLYVATGDVSGDGRPDLIVTPDEGGGPRVRVFDGNGLANMADFFGIEDTNFRGGARAAVGDVNGDRIGDVVVSAGFGGGPRVAVFDGSQLTTSRRKLVNDFFAFEQGLRNGAFVAVGDVSGDGRADLVLGGGPGGGPRVSVLDAGALLQNRVVRTADFFAGSQTDRGGVPLAVKNLDDDTTADVVVGSGTTGGGRMAVYLGTTLQPGQTPTARFDGAAFDGFVGSVFVG